MTCEVPGIWPEDLSISSSLANRDAVPDHAALLLLPGRRAFLHVRRRTAEARLRPREPRLRLLDLPLLLLNLLLLNLLLPQDLLLLKLLLLDLLLADLLLLNLL